MRKCADTLQRLLAEKFPKTIPTMIDLWAQSRTDPYHVYEMLSIGMTERVRPGDGEAKWVDICCKLENWTKFFEKSRDYNHPFSDDEVVKLLVEKRGPREIEHFFESLLRFPKMRGRVESLQAALDKEKGLQSGTHPVLVFEMMPIVREPRLEHSADIQTRGPIVCSHLLRWLEYVYLFRDQYKNFNDAAVVEFLVAKRGLREAMAFFHWLWRVPGMSGRAKLLQLELVTMVPGSLHDMLRLCVRTRTPPDEVIQIMPVQQMEYGEEPWANIVYMLKLWLAYVERFRAQPGNFFSDDSVVDILAVEEQARLADLFVKTAVLWRLLRSRANDFGEDGVIGHCLASSGL
uniref:RxLR effector candidate protein n=1 Tax=Hyaloperonospora arabidopsidis (strain Emoy2) TaxID=559515 RepID=M4BNX3_HYAAE